MEFVASFIFGFSSFCFIVFIVFITQTNRVKKILNNATKEELESLCNLYVNKYDNTENEDDKNINKKWNEDLVQFSMEIPKKVRFFSGVNLISIKSGFKMFFVPLRIFAYILFIIGFFILLRNNYLNLAGLFSGVLVSNVVVVLVLALKNRAN